MNGKPPAALDSTTKQKMLSTKCIKYTRKIMNIDAGTGSSDLVRRARLRAPWQSRVFLLFLAALGLRFQACPVGAKTGKERFFGCKE
jgi:hypothetical protein